MVAVCLVGAPSTPAGAAAGSPFADVSAAFVAQNGAGGATELFQLVNTPTGVQRIPILGPQSEGGPNNLVYNAIAFNPADNYLYGFVNRNGGNGGGATPSPSST